MQRGSYYILSESALIEVTLSEYQRWYADKGRYYTFRNVDLGYSNNMFGGYNGYMPANNENWAPFFLTYSWLSTLGEINSITEYFHTYSELAEQYDHLLTLDWSENSTELLIGSFQLNFDVEELF